MGGGIYMIKVVGIRFRNAGKIYFFAPGEFDVKRGTHVIVETARGVEYGTCVNDPKDVTDDEIVAPLKPILRIATEKDDEQAISNRSKEREAFTLCKEKIIEHQLEMKLIDAEYTFDNSKILFYFTADGRIDFRDLVKDLAGVFRTRIELRQVGVRDETKIIGGIGICGRPLCCHSYLSDFVPVSIKMAKEQNLSLNPTKISGVCGRLMCCLKNEEEVYEEQNRKLPGVGDYVTTALGERGVVQNVNIFRETIKVLVQNGDEKELKEYNADDIRFKKRRKRGKLDLSPEELEQLKSLEPDDIAELGTEIEETIIPVKDDKNESREEIKPETKPETKPEREERPDEYRHNNKNRKRDRNFNKNNHGNSAKNNDQPGKNNDQSGKNNNQSVKNNEEHKDGDKGSSNNHRHHYNHNRHRNRNHNGGNNGQHNNNNGSGSNQT